MSPSEIAFLAMGLAVGATFGAALFGVRRNHPARRREVRITVSPNSIVPRRATTLASSDPAAGRILIPGSPGDDDWLERRLAGLTGDGRQGTNGGGGGRAARTRVPSTPTEIHAEAVAVPVSGGMPPDVRAFAAQDRVSRDADRMTAGVAVRARPTAAVRPGIGQTTATIRIDPEAPNATAVPSGARAAPVAMTAEEPRDGAPAEPAGASTPAGGPDAGNDAGATCATERHLVRERCALADAAREQSRRAAEALREAQRAYDELRERVEQAQSQSDPREIRASKDALHRAFRSARSSATSPAQAEAAAREWLTQVNRLNTGARDAAHIVQTGGAKLRDLLPGLDRVAVEADVARITVETADATCHDARTALARCEEQAIRGASKSAAMAAAAPPPERVESTLDGVWPTEREEPLPVPADVLARDSNSAPVIRILRGDRQALERLVAVLAEPGPETAPEWQLRIAGLVDAIVARAIEAGYLRLPEDGFWGLFNRREQREIVAALSALGFRFDGIGGFADGRVPAQRDLSLAVGYAGLDRMRIRNWPRESELAGLFADASVAADEWLVDEAGDLSLGRMVDALGGRAAELADVWNAWGRVRPALIGDG